MNFCSLIITFVEIVIQDHQKYLELVLASVDFNNFNELCAEYVNKIFNLSLKSLEMLIVH